MARTAPPTLREQLEQVLPALQQESVQDSVANLAYSYWLERQNSGEGSAEEDWLRAEREIHAQHSPQH